MNTVKSLSRRYVLAALLMAATCFTPKASADLLTNTWFKLTFAGRGHTLSNNVAVKTLNVTRTVYLNISTNTPVGSLNNYRLNFWTKTDAGWSNSFTTTKNTLGVNENFFSDLSVVFVGTSNSTISTWHTAYLNTKTNSSGRLRSASYSGGGEIIDGSIGGKRYFGSFSLIGPMTSPSRLPFTP